MDHPVDDRPDGQKLHLMDNAVYRLSGPPHGVTGRQ